MPLLALPWTEGSSGRRPGWRFGWPRHMTLDHMPARLWRLAEDSVARLGTLPR